MSTQYGRALKGLREAAGLTQMVLSERLGVTQSTVSNVEGGRRLPSIELLDRWVEACAGTLQITSTLPGMLDRVAGMIRRLDPEDAALVEKTAAALHRHPANTKTGTIIRGNLDYVAATSADRA